MNEAPSTAPPAEPQRPPPDAGWRDRLDGLAHRAGIDVSPARLVAVALAVAAAIGLAVFVLRPSSGPPVEATLPRASSSATSGASAAPTASAPAPSTAATGSRLVVQAAGAVAKPGVYAIASDSRVNDLVTAAGGFAADADPDQVELAAPLTDGERVYVPRVGESAPPSSGSHGSTSSSSRGPLDLNHANASDLEALPGIGPALAQAIIDHRERNGPFTSVDDLADVRGIGPAKLEQLRPLVKV